MAEAGSDHDERSARTQTLRSGSSTGCAQLVPAITGMASVTLSRCAESGYNPRPCSLPLFQIAASLPLPTVSPSETGQAILSEGGNAWEAMVAMGATIAVTYPHMSGLGGDGFWMVREPTGKVGYIEACGPAGADATIAAYHEAGHDAVPPRGPLGAATVAGVVGGWALALEAARGAGGRLPLDVLFSDAIRHAREGYRVSRGQAENVPKLRDELFAAPGFADHFLKEGKLPAEGELLVQPILAATLDHLVNAGLADFYRGDIAREMAVDLARIGSPVTRDDLARYEARFREPLKLDLKLGTVWNSPPPTQGLASLLILGIAERLDLGRVDGASFVHGLVEATKRAFLIRDLVVTDPRELDHDPSNTSLPRA